MLIKCLQIDNMWLYQVVACACYKLVPRKRRKYSRHVDYGIACTCMHYSSVAPISRCINRYLPIS